MIEEGGTRKGFSTPAVTVSGGGTVTVVNLDSMDHTVTSVAKGADGLPVFDVRVAAGTTATVPGVESLAAGDWAFYCKFHPSMRGVLTVAGARRRGRARAADASTSRWWCRRPKRGADIRLVMRRGRVRTLPDGPAYVDVDLRRHLPRSDHPAARRARHPGHRRQPAAEGRRLDVDAPARRPPRRRRTTASPPRQLIRRGASRTYDYPLTVDGRAEPGSFFWYHDHRMDRTARNNWRGLQGMFIVTDPPTPGLRLPSGRARRAADDLGAVVHARGNQLTDPFADGPRDGRPPRRDGVDRAANAPPDDATVGDTVLVNGRAAPYLDVSATRYRLRLLNSSPFSSYNLTLSDGRPLLQIGTGSGLLPRAVVRSSVLLGPAQRADVIVDFSGATGQRLVLESVPAATGSTGDDARETAVMEFRVGARARDPSRLPSRLPSPELVSPVPAKVSKTWTFGLDEGDHSRATTAAPGRSTARPSTPTRVDHRARLGTVERWRFRNTSDVTHYVHIHAEQWRTLLRDGKAPPPWERGLEDTWRLEPGEEVEVAARFTDYTGAFMIHCHMLDHEDHGMMARFDVVRPDCRHHAGSSAVRISHGERARQHGAARTACMVLRGPVVRVSGVPRRTADA